MLTLDDFTPDRPWTPTGPEYPEIRIDNQIAGVELRRLEQKADGRGSLVVLMSDRYGAQFTTPHVYMVTAAARSIRAWVYHKRQSDRLAYTQGTLRVVLYDLRPDSPTHGLVNVLDVGAANQVMLTIPPFVVHAVQNREDQDTVFVNMPTRAYDPADPDKARLAWNDPRIPYHFE
jgi:dTDP-4-dehydrorhamnose 3,5-epimerase